MNQMTIKHEKYFIPGVGKCLVAVPLAQWGEDSNGFWPSTCILYAQWRGNPTTPTYQYCCSWSIGDYLMMCKTNNEYQTTIAQDMASYVVSKGKLKNETLWKMWNFLQPSLTSAKIEKKMSSQSGFGLVVYHYQVLLWLERKVQPCPLCGQTIVPFVSTGRLIMRLNI